MLSSGVKRGPAASFRWSGKGASSCDHCRFNCAADYTWVIGAETREQILHRNAAGLIVRVRADFPAAREAA